MKVFVCIDDKNGMMFNNRRQSKDRTVVEKVREIIGDNMLCATEYSLSLFPDAKVCENFENIDGFVFIEDPRLLVGDRIEELYIFRWNRHYPSDKKFEMNMEQYELVSVEEFAGYSHEKITLEKYIKRGIENE